MWLCCEFSYVLISLIVQSLSSCSITDAAALQKPDILQCEEGQEEDREICGAEVSEAALWPVGEEKGKEVTYTFELFLWKYFLPLNLYSEIWESLQKI